MRERANSATVPQPGLGRAVRSLRQRAGLSQAELGRRADIHPARISRIEAGKANPSWVEVEGLAGALDVQWPDLWHIKVAGPGDRGELAAFAWRLYEPQRQSGALSAREEAVLWLRAGVARPPATFAETGAAVGVTAERARSIQNAAIVKLRKRLVGDAAY